MRRVSGARCSNVSERSPASGGWCWCSLEHHARRRRGARMARMGGHLIAPPHGRCSGQRRHMMHAKWRRRARMPCCSRLPSRRAHTRRRVRSGRCGSRCWRGAARGPWSRLAGWTRDAFAGWHRWGPMAGRRSTHLPHEPAVILSVATGACDRPGALGVVAG